MPLFLDTPATDMADSVKQIKLEEAPVVHPIWWAQHVTYVEFQRSEIQIIGAMVIHPNPRGHVTLLTGWSETFLKYADIIKQLYDGGYSVFTYDHQCQGLSGRWLPESQSTWVESFEEYVQDLLFFQKHVVKTPLGVNNFLLAHSMGGLVGGHAMAQRPTLFHRAFLSSPMFRNKCGMKDINYRFPLPTFIIHRVMRLVHFIGGGTDHCIGNSLETAEQALPRHVTTSDDDHLADWRALRMKHPHVMATCPCNDWLLHALDASRDFEQAMYRVVTPTIVVNCDNDVFVENFSMEAFARNAQEARLLQCPNAYHEVLFEKSLVRGACLKVMHDFFSADADSVENILAPHPLVEYQPNAPRMKSVRLALAWAAGAAVGLAVLLVKRDGEGSFALRSFSLSLLLPSSSSSSSTK